MWNNRGSRVVGVPQIKEARQASDKSLVIWSLTHKAIFCIFNSSQNGPVVFTHFHLMPVAWLQGGSANRYQNKVRQKGSGE